MVNEWQVIGNIGRVMTADGRVYGSIAVNKNYKKNDEWVRDVSWFNWVAFGKTAENIKQYVKAGYLVRLAGECSVTKKEDKSYVSLIVREYNVVHKPATKEVPEEAPTVEPDAAPNDDLPF